MSVALFRKFSNALKISLPRLPNRTVTPLSQIRFIAAMDVATTETPSDEIIPNKKFTRFRKRQWDFRDEKSNSETGESDAKKDKCDGEDKPVVERIKKKKMAILLGYSGVNYYGMQRNPGVRTIEEDLLKAMLEAKYITEDDFKNQQNVQFQRSSRTDKGVSAARQVVSLKLPLEAKMEEINKSLPDCIRVFGIKTVTKKFNSKTKCNARTYSYTLPTYVFDSSVVTEDERKKFRILAEKLEKVNQVLSIYKGTKCYHNFTEKKHFQDPSASRFMMSFAVEKTFVENDMEFAVLLVKGQSFMLHQIRKMVGVAVAVLRGHAPSDLMDRVFGKDKVMIPTAPGLGLVLDMVHYDRYDARYKTTHDSLAWDEVEETVQTFKHTHIYPSIVKGEIEDNSFGTWLEKLNQHNYEPSEEIPLKDDEIGGDDDEDDEKDDDDEGVAGKEVNSKGSDEKSEGDLKGVASDLKSVESDLKGVESDLKGVESDLKGVESDLKGVDSNLKNVESDLKDVEKEKSDN